MTAVRRRFWKKEEAPEFVEGQQYTERELELMADAMLKADSKQEMCRKCGCQGFTTGVQNVGVQHGTTEEGVIVDIGLALVFPELECKNGHTWFQGEGKDKGFKGKNPVLLEEHLIARKRREIMCENGTPDPNIVAGLYNRTHPDGRRVNSKESRERHGASFYS
jgi:hypothetical protein